MSFQEPIPRQSDSPVKCDVCDHLALPLRPCSNIMPSRVRRMGGPPSIQYSRCVSARGRVDQFIRAYQKSGERAERARSQSRAASVKTRDRVLRLVKPKQSNQGESFFLDKIESA